MNEVKLKEKWPLSNALLGTFYQRCFVISKLPSPSSLQMKYIFVIFIYFPLSLKCDESLYNTRIITKKSFDRSQAYISLGQPTYKKFVEHSNIFIDTSLLIQTIFEDADPDVVIITYPRRWGKTINLDMIRTYLEIQVNKFGKKLTPLRDTPNYRLFINGKLDWVNDTVKPCLNHPLLIAKNETLTKNYLGKYPVIYLNFEHVNGDEYFPFVASLKDAISDMYLQHEYMAEIYQSVMSNDKNPKEAKDEAVKNYDTFMKYLSGQQSNAELENSVYFLTEILHNHFKKKVFVLFDEYDAPFVDLHLNGNPMKLEFKDELVTFLRFFIFHSLVRNNHTEKVVFTGIASLTNGSCLPKHLKYSYYSFFDEPICHFYGIEEKDIIELFQMLDLDDDLFYRAIRQYGGYTAGWNNQLKMFNPWSIAHFVDNKTTIGQYWMDFADADRNFQDFLRIEAFRKTFDAMLFNGSQTIYLQEPLSFTVEHLRAIETFFNASEPEHSTLLNVTELAWKLCFMGGYVTLEKSCTANWFYMKFPNRELRPFMQKQIEFYYRNITDVRTTVGYDIEGHQVNAGR